jgi:hypothetical protein
MTVPSERPTSSPSTASARSSAHPLPGSLGAVGGETDELLANDRPHVVIVPIDRAGAKAFVRKVHRHHPNPTAGAVFQIAAAIGGEIVGVALVGRPLAVSFCDGWTLEVNRTCTVEAKNVNSALYGAAWRAAKALGYRRLITYTQKGESGVSLRAAGYRIVAERPARPGWDSPSRPRINDAGGIERTLWDVA